MKPALAAGEWLVNETLTVRAGSADGTPVRPVAVFVTSSRVNPHAPCPHWSNEVSAAYWAGVGSTGLPLLIMVSMARTVAASGSSETGTFAASTCSRGAVVAAQLRSCAADGVPPESPPG